MQLADPRPLLVLSSVLWVSKPSTLASYRQGIGFLANRLLLAAQNLIVVLFSITFSISSQLISRSLFVEFCVFLALSGSLPWDINGSKT